MAITAARLSSVPPTSRPHPAGAETQLEPRSAFPAEGKMTGVGFGTCKAQAVGDKNACSYGKRKWVCGLSSRGECVP